MLFAVREFVQNVIVVIMLAAILQIVLPSGGTRRYAQLAVGLVMVLTLLTPLLALMRAPFDLSQMLGQAEIRTAWSELRVGSEYFREQNEAGLLLAYRSTLTEQVKRLVDSIGELVLLECRLQLVEDHQKEDFGRILSIEVVLSEGEVVQPVTTIQPVQVGPGQTQGGTRPSSSGAKQALVRQTLASYFALGPEQVDVTIR